MNRRRIYDLVKDVPMLKKGRFVFYDYDARVHWIENGKESEYPLRAGLSNYLWLLLTEKAYLKHIETTDDD